MTLRVHVSMGTVLGTSNPLALNLVYSVNSSYLFFFSMLTTCMKSLFTLLEELHVGKTISYEIHKGLRYGYKIPEINFEA